MRRYPEREVIDMKEDKKKEDAVIEEHRENSEDCCSYVMDPSGEYYFSNGCCKEPLRHCLR